MLVKDLRPIFISFADVQYFGEIQQHGHKFLEIYYRTKRLNNIKIDENIDGYHELKTFLADNFELKQEK